LEINERGTFSDPPPIDGQKKNEQEIELFQTARLINCGWFGAGVYIDLFLGSLVDRFLSCFL
jgi:linoleate 10R-lipoxygenase